MKNVQDVAAHAEAMKSRALTIIREFRVHANDPQKVIDLADELIALIDDYEAQATALEEIQEMAELLATRSCSGPH